MIRKAFCMKLHPNQKEEYEKRHKNLWPEMAEMIREYGGGNYSIFLDEKTGVLFGYIEIASIEQWDKSADTQVCRKWWDYMADLMETNCDNSPVTKDLIEVFHLE